MDSIIPQNTPQDKTHYVYVYRYPESMGGAIFYVGKGQGPRIDDHEAEARGEKHSCNPRKIAVIKEIWAGGEQVAKEKVAFFKDESDAYLYEWALMNMTTYADKLTNIDYGKGRSRPRLLHKQYGAFCIQKHQGRGKSAHLAIYHKVSDINSFCISKHIQRETLRNLLDGKIGSFRGYSLLPDCSCGHTSLTLEKEYMPNPVPKKEISHELETKMTKVTQGAVEEDIHPLLRARIAQDLSTWDYACALGLKHNWAHAIEEWETGMRIPQPKHAKKIAELLNFSSPEELRHLCRKWQQNFPMQYRGQQKKAIISTHTL